MTGRERKLVEDRKKKIINVICKRLTDEEIGLLREEVK